MDDQLMLDYSWSVKGNHQFKHKPKPFTKPRLKQAISLMGTAMRCRKHLKECKKRNIDSHIDFFSPLVCQQKYGVPIGGIGTGSIGRTYTGDFCRFQLVPGLYEHKTAEANLFTIRIHKKSSTAFQQSLCTHRRKLRGLKSWNTSLAPSRITYHALYPESYTIYDFASHNVKLTCHQLSPIIPHNYKDTSLPCALFNWTVENNNKEDIEISLMLTWQSGSSSNKFSLSNVSSMPFESYKSSSKHLSTDNRNNVTKNSNSNSNSKESEISGVLLKQNLRGMPLDYCISVKSDGNAEQNVDVSYNCQFYPDDEQSGRNLWNDLLEDGALNNNKYHPDEVITSNQNKKKPLKMAVAVCAKIKVKAMSKATLDFSLVWYMPNISFPGDNKTTFQRFYNRFFPMHDPNSPLNIALYSLAKRTEWMAKIREWREPILKNESLPKFYKYCLFNELYFISDGGTIWIDIEEDKCANSFVKEYGRFAYLEGHEYRMYNTYDVHFYASFALLKLWPKLQLSLQYDFAQTIEIQNENVTKFLFNGKVGLQKSRNCIPHDIGEPEAMPWQNLNAYILHDTKDWKDLNLKFILTVYRDYFHTKDHGYLTYMWPYIKILLVTIESQDKDKDGLIDSEGEPDQTYDAWSVKGASAYCGGLHIASLQCICKMAELLDDPATLGNYQEKLKRAKLAYDSKLWNGKYYKYDGSESSYSDSIMADMCCGHWFLRCSGLNYEAFEQEKVESSLKHIFANNVMLYENGTRGAVNGMKPNGQVDITSMQSEEVWIGVTDALASLMIYEGMTEQAWKTLEGLYNLCYNELGLAFQMPEALFKSNVYRSLGYMRPLCIWSIQYAIDHLNDTNNNSSSSTKNMGSSGCSSIASDMSTNEIHITINDQSPANQGVNSNQQVPNNDPESSSMSSSASSMTPNSSDSALSSFP